MRASAHRYLRLLRARNPLASRPIYGRCKFYGRALLLAGGALWLAMFVVALASDGEPSPVRGNLVGLSIALLVLGGLAMALGVHLEVTANALNRARASGAAEMSQAVENNIDAKLNALSDVSFVDGAFSMEGRGRTIRPTHGKARKK